MAVNGGQQPEYYLSFYEAQAVFTRGSSTVQKFKNIYDTGTTVALVFSYGSNTQRPFTVLLTPLYHPRRLIT